MRHACSGQGACRPVPIHFRGSRRCHGMQVHWLGHARLRKRGDGATAVAGRAPRQHGAACASAALLRWLPDEPRGEQDSHDRLRNHEGLGGLGGGQAASRVGPEPAAPAHAGPVAGPRHLLPVRGGRQHLLRGPRRRLRGQGQAGRGEDGTELRPVRLRGPPRGRVRHRCHGERCSDLQRGCGAPCEVPRHESGSREGSPLQALGSAALLGSTAEDHNSRLRARPLQGAGFTGGASPHRSGGHVASAGQERHRLRGRPIRPRVQGVHSKHGAVLLRELVQGRPEAPLHRGYHRRCDALVHSRGRLAGRASGRHEGVHVLRPRQRRHGRSEQERGEADRSRNRPVHAGLLRVRRQEERWCDHQPLALRTRANPRALQHPHRRLCSCAQGELRPEV
mmetsp:Transcript_99134/g.256259  ORF Transcript_99134/g.256259 Transcript_99134/m.256259 type:complete len:394 (+) Transcript_99134:583-1764(+)